MESSTEEGLEPCGTTREPKEMFTEPDSPTAMRRRRHSEHHRRHEFLGIRLQSFTDAVFAIVGTILTAYLNQVVVPRLEDPNKSLQQQSLDHISFVTVYHFTFLHISVIWLNHSRVFSVIERVNDVVIWLNMVFLYAVSFVPLTFGFLGEFNDTYEGIVIPSITIILINTTMVVMVWYVFRRKSFLPSDMSGNHVKYFERAMYFKLLITPLLAGLAIGFGTVSLLAGQILFYSSVFVVIIPKVVAYCIWWSRKTTEITAQIVHVMSITISKDRIEFFADGVYSIVATLVILDITMIGIPSRDVVNEKFNGSLVRALDHNRLDYITYFTTFLVISLLWFVHHSLFNFIKQLNSLMFITHQCSLSFVGVVPGSIGLLSDFYRFGTSDGNKATGLQIAATSVAVVSLLQFLLLALMCFADEEYVDQTLFHSKSSLHLLVKVTIIPTACVAAYWCSFGSEDIQYYSFYALYITTPLAFVLINILIKWTELLKFCQYCWGEVSMLVSLLKQVKPEKSHTKVFEKPLHTEQPPVNSEALLY